MHTNLANRLPLPVYPIDRDRADYAISKNRLSDYFVRNPALFQRALDPVFTVHAVQMAAHACGLWFDTWRNPESGQMVLVVANKDVMPLKAMFQRTLKNQSVIAALSRRS